MTKHTGTTPGLTLEVGRVVYEILKAVRVAETAGLSHMGVRLSVTEWRAAAAMLSATLAHEVAAHVDTPPPAAA